MEEKIEAICAVIMVVVEIIKLFMESKRGPDDKSSPLFILSLIISAILNRIKDRGFYAERLRHR